MRHRATSACFLALLFITACAADPGRVPRRERTSVLAAAEGLAPVTIDNAYGAVAEGVGSRTVFTDATQGDYVVEVRDLIVAPRKRSGEATFPGPVVLLVRQGRGVLQGANREELVPGRSVTIPPATRFSIENTSAVPMAIRAYVLAPKGVTP